MERDGFEEVLRHFLECERLRVDRKYQKQVEYFLGKSWSQFEALKKEIRLWGEGRSGAWGTGRIDTNPALVWLVGLGGDLNRPQGIERWELRRDIPLRELVIEAMNDRVNPLVVDVQGSVVQLVERYQDDSRFKCEFPHVSEVPETEWPSIICREFEGGVGKYEILDGAHRSVSAALKSYKGIHGFVGVLKK